MAVVIWSIRVNLRVIDRFLKNRLGKPDCLFIGYNELPRRKPSIKTENNSLAEAAVYQKKLKPLAPQATDLTAFGPSRRRRDQKDGIIQAKICK
jgi:hypothetical protein